MTFTKLTEMLDMAAIKNLAVAGTAMSSPLWLERATGALDGASQFAAALLPILGCLLAIFQGVKLWKDWNKPKQ